MRKLTGILMVVATPALAHDGFHFHPHGGEIVLGFVVALGAGVMIWRRR
jgi:hypothetical protein